MPDIEICYRGDDGKPALFYRPNCISNFDARRQALMHTNARFRSAEIWNELECVETIVLRYAA
jgi:hypothetical protein